MSKLQSTANKYFTRFIRAEQLVFALIFLLAFIVRFYSLDSRPMHVDEAVHAVKFGELLEKGDYKYDPIEYHGPSLNYLTIITAWVRNETSYSTLTETTLRMIPATISLIPFLLLIIFNKVFERKNVIVFLLLASVSSPLVFYERYYIQESLLVNFFFSFIICLFHYFKTNKNYSLFLSSLFLGLAVSSKETVIISLGAFSFALFFSGIKFADTLKIIRQNSLTIIFSFILFITVVVLLFTSFFSNPQGIKDFFVAYFNYFEKASQFHDHIHPWYFYIQFFSFRNIEGFYFTELPFMLLFFVGSFFLFFSKNKSRFIKILFFFSLIIFIIYSIIPYKTPWLILTSLQSLLFVSAFGLVKISEILNKKYFVVLLIVFALFSFNQLYRVVFKYSFHPQNPFVYAHSTDDIFTIEEKANQIIEALPNGEYLSVYVAANQNDYWPLPWTLRKFKNISFNNNIEKDTYKYPLIFATPSLENDLVNNLYSEPASGEMNLYIPLFEELMLLRPKVEIRGYIRKDILDLLNK
jgi:uncharacterized protein (TIGR03663 family)